MNSATHMFDEPMEDTPANAIDHGTYDTVHHDAKAIMPSSSIFSGFRLHFLKPVSNHLQVGHNLELSGKKSSYHFCPTYIGTLNRLSPQESFPIVMGDIDTKGNVMANIIHDFSRQIRAKLSTQSQHGDIAGTQMELEYKVPKFSMVSKLINFNPFKGDVVWASNFLQEVTPNFALGSEFMVQRGTKFGMASQLSFIGRYRSKNFTAACTAGLGGISATYVQEIDKQVSVASEFEIDLASAQAIGAIGVQYRLQKSIFKAQITSEGHVASYFERYFQPGMKLMFSALLDHVSGSSKFGFGLSIGQ